MPKEGMCVATVYAQIMFPPCNALVFKETSSGNEISEITECCRFNKRVSTLRSPTRSFRKCIQNRSGQSCYKENRTQWTPLQDQQTTGYHQIYVL